MPPLVDELDRIIELLRQTSRVDVAENFLRDLKGVAFSASIWNDVHTRFRAALEANAITIEQLWAFQQDAEEHGHQHTFLFRGGDAELTCEMIDPQRVSAQLGKARLGLSLGQHRVVDKPSNPVITNVRVEPSALGGNCLVIKVVETRIHRRALAPERQDDREIVQILLEKHRGVNVARLHANGILELRIREHTLNEGDKIRRARNKTETYKLAIADLRKTIALALPYQERYMTEVSLAAAKNSLWDNQADLKEKIRFNYTKMGSSKGGFARFGTNTPAKGIGADPATAASMDEFKRHRGTYHDTMNLWWLKGDAPNPIPSAEVHVRIGGNVNEFTVPTHCNGRDYNHVFGDIAKNNQKITP